MLVLRLVIVPMLMLVLVLMLVVMLVPMVLVMLVLMVVVRRSLPERSPSLGHWPGSYSARDNSPRCHAHA